MAIHIDTPSYVLEIANDHNSRLVGEFDFKGGEVIQSRLIYLFDINKSACLENGRKTCFRFMVVNVDPSSKKIIMGSLYEDKSEMEDVSGFTVEDFVPTKVARFKV
jgi:hypothetical protein